MERNLKMSTLAGSKKQKPADVVILNVLKKFPVSDKWLISFILFRIDSGTHDNPTVIINVSDENWLALVNGRTDGQTLLMHGQLTPEGNILAATLIKKLSGFR